MLSTSLKPVSVTDNTTVWQAGKAAVAGLVSSAVTSGGLLASTALNSYSTAKKLWQNIWGNPDLGWDSKALLSATAIPGTIWHANKASSVSGAGFGLWRGYTEVLENGGGVKSAAQKSLDDVKKADRAVFEYHQTAAELVGAWLASDLPNTPYDVSLPKALSALFASAFSSVTTGAVAGFWTGARSLEIVPRLLSEIDDDKGSNLARKAALASAVLFATPLAVAAASVSGSAAGFGTALKTGYTKGLDAAVAEMKANWAAIYDASVAVLQENGISALGEKVKTEALAQAMANPIVLEAVAKRGLV